ncbi:MAG: endolytic transglycosylase MltG [Halanaerobiales bacterium]
MKKAGIFFFLIIIMMTIVLFINHLIFVPIHNNNELVTLQIHQGTTSAEIGELLYDKGLIKSELLFNIILRLRGQENMLKAGYYQFDSSADMIKVIDKLAAGRVATFKITIPEGFTLKEIAEKLSEKTPYTKKEILETAENMEINFIDNKPKNVKYCLEGFLYPDTYIIPREYTPEQLLEAMLAEFKKQSLDYLINNDNNDFNAYHLLTIASLIEEEGKIEAEKPLIAAVIYNRLEENMPLQIDASIQYILSDRKETILYRDLEIKSRYNTYKNHGLPPGPICSPGINSIKAALAPAEVDYLFYFALEDGSHKFTENYQDHIYYQNKMSEEYYE